MFKNLIMYTFLNIIFYMIGENRFLNYVLINFFILTDAEYCK